MSLNKLIIIMTIFLENSGKGIWNYPIKISKQCNMADGLLFTKAGLSLKECVSACASRPKCAAMKYFRRSTTCVILRSVADEVRPLDWVQTSCVFLVKEDIQNADDTECICTGNKVCDITVKTVQGCVIKECSPIFDVNNGVIHGNIYTLGSQLKYSCKKKYTVYNNEDRLTCLASGDWDKEPKCIVDCGEPSEGNNADLSSGFTTAGSKRTYTCHTGYYYGNDQTSVIVECLSTTGTWSITDVQCARGCSDPSEGNNADLSSGLTTAGSKRIYTCHTGYYYGTGQTSVIVECLSTTGTWSITDVQCVRGRKNGEACSTASPCGDTMSLCIQSTCFCKAMYKYDQEAGDCVRRCSVLSDNFDIYSEIYFLSYNDRRVHSSDIDECLTSCRSDPDCFHVEKWTKHCNLGKVTYFMMTETAPHDIRPSTSATIYSRICT